MASEPSVSIHNLTKEEITQKLSFYLGKASAGRIVKEQAYHDLLYSLLLTHPKAEEKIGCGVKHFLIAPSERFPQSVCFHVERLDGTREEFSYKRCIQTPRERALTAARQMVQDQMLAARAFFLSSQNKHLCCALTGLPITTIAWEVDHAPSFSSLFDQFLASKGHKEGDTLNLDGWKDYHALHARVRPVCKRANARQGKNTGDSFAPFLLCEILAQARLNPCSPSHN